MKTKIHSNVKKKSWKKKGDWKKSLCQIIRGKKNNILTSTNEKLISTSDLTKPPQPNTPFVS